MKLRAHLIWGTFFAALSLLASASSAAQAGPDAPLAVPTNEVVSLRKAIADLTTRFGGRYAQGGAFLARLNEIGQRPQFSREDFDKLRREALVANPLVSGQPLLFIARAQYASDHHNTETMFQTGEINTGSFRGPGALKLIDLRAAQASPVPATQAPGAAPTPKDPKGAKQDLPGVRTLLAMPEGIVRDPDISFDGRKILFAMRRDRKDDYHVYEINADGTDLKQLTYGSGTSDIDPIYLPDGRILFSSSREPKYCMCNRHIMCNLYTMDADGANIQQIGHSTLHEGHASLLPDGRVLYDRWEYVDRNFGDAQGLWTVNPDGTSHVVYYGNNTGSPGAKLEARPIPGTELVLCTFSSCHDRPWGALAILDRGKGVDGREPVLRTWPADAINLVNQTGGYDTFSGVRTKYEDPCPLSENYFLCSRMTGKGEQMGLYLLDTFGNEILLHVEGEGCFDPMPLAARPRPPVIPSRIDLTQPDGTFYVSDVYEGTGMSKVKPGAIKSLRVVRSPEKRFWTGPGWDGGTGQQAPGMAWNDFNNKEILGTAPVEADGSAYFSVPADKFVCFQLLDEQGMMVQSMRSGTTVRPGEQAGCIGCHEYRLGTGSYKNQSLALRRGPSKLVPWHGPTRTFSYLVEVQPALDKACVSCHDYGKEAGRKLNLAGDLNVCFNTSYVELRSKGYVHVVGAGPTTVQAPYTWGSHASRLTKVLLQGHGKPEIDREVKLDPESLDRILTWIDINAPYYPEYAGGPYRDKPYGRCPIDDGQLNRITALTGTPLTGGNMSKISFTRPEISPCLEKLDRNSPQYLEALKLIRVGHDNLATNPRPDMAGFQLSGKVEVEQQRKYDALRQAEAEARAASVAGRKFYEHPHPSAENRPQAAAGNHLDSSSEKPLNQKQAL